MKNYTRRNFIKKATTGLVATLAAPAILMASPTPYPYKTPTCRDDLYEIPTNHLIARKIYGEARGEDLAEKIAIGYTPFNRKKMEKSYYGKGSLKAVLLHIEKGRHQYDCFNDTSKDKSMIRNFQETLDPARYNPKAWKECLGIADWILEKPNIRELNQGQTSYVTIKVAKKLRNKEGLNWLKRSIPIEFPLYQHTFKHDFVREPTIKELKQILKTA